MQLTLQEIRERRANKPKIGRRKVIRKIRAGVGELANRKTVEKITQRTRIAKPLAKLIGRKREGTDEQY